MKPLVKLIAELSKAGHINPLQAYALIAAIDLARERWDAAATRKFGVIARDILHEDKDDE